MHHLYYNFTFPEVCCKILYGTGGAGVTRLRGLPTRRPLEPDPGNAGEGKVPNTSLSTQPSPNGV